MRKDARDKNFPSRIEPLRERMLRTKPSIGVERARLYTESMKQTETEPMVIRQAKAFAHMMDNIPVTIFPQELIVGTMVRKPPGAIVFPEGVGLRAFPELDDIGDRDVNPFEVSDEELRILKDEIEPYWSTRSIPEYAEHVTPSKIIDRLYEGAFFVLTELAGISHVSINYPYLISVGFEKIKNMANKRIGEYEQAERTDPDSTDKSLFYRSAELVAEGVIRFAQRYSRKARELAKMEKKATRREELLRIADNCKNVPAKPPKTFYEALQFIWFVQLALHQENYEQGISMGRMDQYLYEYYKRDLEAGFLDFEKAVELVSCLWIKTCEILPLFDSFLTMYFSGLLTNQAVTLSGVNENGEDATNELTYVMIEANRRVALRQPNVHVRLHRKSPDKLWNLLTEIVASGTNNIALFNDDVVIEALSRKGIPLRDAKDYATVGCVELAPFGKAFTSSDAALFNLPTCLDLALNNGVSTASGELVGVQTGDSADFKSINDVLTSFRSQLSYLIKEMIIGSNSFEIANRDLKPTPFLSLCVEGCFEKGKDITTGSATYNFTGVQGVGLADVADSLAALDRVVFANGKVSMGELTEALRNNFEGDGDLRQLLINKSPKYGNDNDIADKYAELVARMYSEEIGKYRNVRDGDFTPGIYSLSTQIGLGFQTSALPSGRKHGEPLSNGISPCIGSERKGVTAAMRSVTKIDHALFPNGVSYTVTLSPTLFEGGQGLNNLKALIKTYMELGGMHIHFNIVNVKELLDAQKNPERYRHLMVRVGGFSAYFVDLTREMQNEIISKCLEDL
ncbi:MAG: glycyl radical protein [Promethearchaeota archaeon]